MFLSNLSEGVGHRYSSIVGVVVYLLLTSTTDNVSSPQKEEELHLGYRLTHALGSCKYNSGMCMVSLPAPRPLKRI